LFGAYEPTFVGRPRYGPFSPLPTGVSPLKLACVDDRSFVGFSNWRLGALHFSFGTALHFSFGKHSPRLRVLDLRGLAITDAGLRHLEGMKGLRVVCLNACPKVTTEGVFRLQEALPNCQIVR
jgi:hypothetical protein